MKWLALATALLLGTPAAAQDVLTEAEQEVARQSIGADLRDPYSAVYTFDRVVRVQEKDKTNIFVCGTVNSKNLYGAYVGRHAFAGWFEGPGFKAFVDHEPTLGDKVPETWAMCDKAAALRDRRAAKTKPQG